MDVFFVAIFSQLPQKVTDALTHLFASNALEKSNLLFIHTPNEGKPVLKTNMNMEINIMHGSGSGLEFIMYERNDPQPIIYIDHKPVLLTASTQAAAAAETANTIEKAATEARKNFNFNTINANNGREMQHGKNVQPHLQQHITPVIRRVRNDTNTGNGNATNGTNSPNGTDGTNGTNGTNDQHRVSLTTPSGVSHSDSTTSALKPLRSIAGMLHSLSDKMNHTNTGISPTSSLRSGRGNSERYTGRNNNQGNKGKNSNTEGSGRARARATSEISYDNEMMEQDVALPPNTLEEALEQIALLKSKNQKLQKRIHRNENQTTKLTGYLEKIGNRILQACDKVHEVMNEHDNKMLADQLQANETFMNVIDGSLLKDREF